MRRFVEARPFGSFWILGLGVNDLRWLMPVRPGDILELRGEIVELKPSRSKPEPGAEEERRRERRASDLSLSEASPLID
jgi:acyl dehydratase